MPRPKGLPKTGGRQKGTRNKAPELRALISQALEEAGGVSYLVRQAEENPGPFLALLGRMLPREMHAEIKAELTVKQEIRRDLVDKLVVLMMQPTQIPQDSAALIEQETHVPQVRHEQREHGHPHGTAPKPDDTAPQQDAAQHARPLCRIPASDGGAFPFHGSSLEAQVIDAPGELRESATFAPRSRQDMSHTAVQRDVIHAT